MAAALNPGNVAAQPHSRDVSAAAPRRRTNGITDLITLFQLFQQSY